MEGLIGRTLGKYRLVEQLGRGGMAEVYKAYQPGLDRYVAVKVMHSFLSEDKDFLARFQREAKLVAGMRHPNIVQVHDFDVEGGLSYMVMEFIDGETLKGRLQKLEENNQWISVDEAVRIIMAVGSALKYAHRLGMVHRDVKPANVMVDKTGNVILTDFGIAKIFAGGGATQLTATGAMVGTPSYMAPEQGMGQPGDERSDIYSLGVMLYQFVTARLPFEADTPLAVILKHINDPLPMPRQVNPEVPEAVERVILKAMARNPDDRYQHIGEMLNDLKRAMGMSLDETPTDTLRSRALPAGATSVSTEAVTPFPAAARTVVRTGAGQPAPGPTVLGHTVVQPARQAGMSRWVVALGVVAVMFIVAVGVIAVIVMNQQSQARAKDATATALALAVVAKPTETATPAPKDTPTPSSFIGTVLVNNAELRSTSNDSSPVIGVLPQGSQLTIRARTVDNAWLRVEAADGTVGWMSAKSVDLGGIQLAAIPQSVLQSAPTATPDLAATVAACKPAAQVADVTAPDGAQFKPGETFVKTWRLTSAGNCPWEKGSTLAFQTGEKFSASDSVPVDAVEVGKSVDVSLNLKAPQSPGTYTGQWALQRPSGQVITTTDVNIVVPAPTPTRGPAPTAPPAAAATATPQASGAIGPVGTGGFDAGYSGWINCVSRLTGESGSEAWVWEADFGIDVHGGNAGYFIVGNPTNCRWDYVDKKFYCRWSGRVGNLMVQSVTVSCPGCKPIKVDVSASIRQDKGGTCRNE
jgi:tRNA A-37 threonylcarbamoyl transferase component Bud32